MGLDEVFGLLLLVALLGVVVYVIRAKVPMDGQVKWVFDTIVWVICALVVIFLIYWVVIFLLALGGIHPRLPGRVG